ncbi:MAG: STAS domain-containing protein [Verrucomicrobiota bacterium]|nr:STAS domain-containing protein [Verrucomicrobiota bacterium]
MANEPPAPFAVLKLEGDIDLYHSPEVKERLGGLIDQKPKGILVDLSAVDYMDSSGLALLIEAMQRIQAYGGRLALFGLRESVQTIFEVARLDQIFTLFPDESAARTGVGV